MKSLGYMLAALIVLLGLFVWFRPGAAGPITDAVGTAALPAQDPGSASRTAAPPATLEAAAASGPSASQPQSVAAPIELVVANGRLISGPAVAKVKQGDRVQLAVTVDSADELHLHGYNMHLDLRPGQRALLDFVASKTGRFTYELHHADIELGAIEVYPR